MLDSRCTIGGNQQRSLSRCERWDLHTTTSKRRFWFVPLALVAQGRASLTAVDKEGDPVEVNSSVDDKDDNPGRALRTKEHDCRRDEQVTNDTDMVPVGRKRRTLTGEQGPSAQEEEIPRHETSETGWKYEEEDPLQVLRRVQTNRFLISQLRVVYKATYLQTGRCSLVVNNAYL